MSNCAVEHDLDIYLSSLEKDCNCEIDCTCADEKESREYDYAECQADNERDEMEYDLCNN